MRFNWLMVCGVWLVMATMLVFPTLQGRPLGVVGDDAMRMVEAIDLLNGQSWTDTTSYRDNTPYGAPMHWSRLVDAPIAGLIAVLKPVLGAEAPAVAAIAWPLLLLFGFFALVMALSDRLGGTASRIPAMALAMLALPIYSEFTPGRVDHHNVQILLTLALMLTTIIGRTSTKMAVLAGVIAATSLTIGTESLPTLVVALAVFPVFWLIDPAKYRQQTVGFVLSFGLATAGNLLLATPWTALFQTACDALSINYVTVAALYTIGVLAAMLSGPLALPWRIAALGAAGAAALVLTALLFPACLGGPYGDLDPRVAQILLTDIGEVLPVWRMLDGLAPAAVSLLVLPLTGMLAAALACLLTSGEKRLDWLVLLAFSIVLVLVMLLQVRGLRLATAPALPAGAWLVATAWSRFKVRQNLASAAIVAVTCFAFAGAAHFALAKNLFPGPAPSDGINTDACLLPENFEKLAALPTGRIISFLLVGPQIMYYTPHSIVTAGYHRNGPGLLDAARFFSGDEAEALAVSRERGLDYYVYCRGISPEFGLHGLAPFNPVDADGALWSWLRPLSEPTEAIQIYAITPPA